MEETNTSSENKNLEFKNRIDLSELQQNVYQIKEQLQKVIVGQKDMIDLLVVSILSDGHALIEGVPGVAKTITAKLISKTMSIDFSRIQFTPDLMPSDILGTSIFNVKTSDFEFKKGPIFSNLVLIDEINRAPAKTQAALFEVMEERQITIDGSTYKMTEPFIVLATQNPIEQEGTYPLPEAQLDRFMFNIPLDYPSYEEEIQVVKATTSNQKHSLTNIVSSEQILFFQDLIRKIPIADNTLEYAVNLATKTRPNTAKATDMVNNYISWGAGPRASQYLVLGAKCHAAINGKYAPDIEDVQAIANYVLRHRIVRNYKAEAEGISEEKVIESLF